MGRPPPSTGEMSRPPAAFVAALLLVTAGCAAGPGPVATPSVAVAVTVTVTEVVDGDTLDVRYRNGSTDTVRLLGIDTPEVHAENQPGEYEGVPATAAGADCLRRAGRNASAYVRDRLLGRSVGLAFDPRADRRGGYGRLLAYVHAGNESVNYRLVAAGHARVFDSEFAGAKRYYRAESRAMEAGRGLWRCRSPGTATGDGS